MDLDALVEKSLAKLATGDFSGISHLIVASALDDRTGSDFDTCGVVANEIFDLPDVNLQDAINNIVAEAQNEKN